MRTPVPASLPLPDGMSERCLPAAVRRGSVSVPWPGDSTLHGKDITVGVWVPCSRVSKVSGSGPQAGPFRGQRRAERLGRVSWSHTGPALPHMGCVTLGQSLGLSEPQFPHLWREGLGSCLIYRVTVATEENKAPAPLALCPRERPISARQLWARHRWEDGAVTRGGYGL